MIKKAIIFFSVMTLLFSIAGIAFAEEDKTIPEITVNSSELKGSADCDFSMATTVGDLSAGFDSFTETNPADSFTINDTAGETDSNPSASTCHGDSDLLKDDALPVFEVSGDENVSYTETDSLPESEIATDIDTSFAEEELPAPIWDNHEEDFVQPPVDPYFIDKDDNRYSI